MMRSSTLTSRSEFNQDRQQRGNVVEFARRSYSKATDFVSDSGSKIKQEFTPNPDAVLWKGLVAGLAAGLAATAVMTVFQLGWSKAKSKLDSKDEQQSSEQKSDQDEPSTVKVADTISKGVLDRPLKSKEKDAASYAVHFAFGTLMGGLYGISSEYLPVAKLGQGVLHGLALWTGADVVALPALKLSGPVAERSSGELAYEILAHAVYGVSSESTRKVFRGWLN